MRYGSAYGKGKGDWGGGGGGKGGGEECGDFKRGVCTRGASCRYAHVVSSLQLRRRRSQCRGSTQPRPATNPTHPITSHHITGTHVNVMFTERTNSARRGWLATIRLDSTASRGEQRSRSEWRSGSGSGVFTSGAIRGGGFLSLCLTKICAMSSCGSRIAYLLQ